MAALKKIEDHLNCSICLDTYTNPKLLQCNHVYCQGCLVKLVIRDQQGQLILTCPNCRQVTPVPARGVVGLQTAFWVNKLLEIVEEQKMADVEAVQEKVESVFTNSTPKLNTTVVCPEHGEREVELYCNTCKETICFKCVIKDSKHQNHDYEELNKAFERYQQEITSSLEPLEKQLENIKKALQQFDVRHDEISNQQATIEADIHSTVARLHEILDIRKTELIRQLHQLTQDKLKSLAAQRDQIETTQAQLTSCLLFMKENLKTGNQGEALLMKSTTVRQVEELTTAFQPDMLEPNTEANMMLSLTADVTAMIQNFGRILAMGPPDPSKCIATGEGIKMAAVEGKSSVLLKTLSSDDVPSGEALDSISCELVSEITGTRIEGSAERRGQSQYEISYQPTIKGRHQLYIKVGGQNIKGSPFSIAATSLKKPSSEIATIRGVSCPFGVAVNQRGEVVMAEWGEHRVTVVSPSGKRLSFGSFSSGSWYDSGYSNPDGVALDGEGNIFVAYKIDHRIRKYSAKGDLLKETRIKFYPRGVAFSASTDKVYVTVSDHVQILDSDLQPAGRFGKRGSNEGEFSHLKHIACDLTGKVYVADKGNSSIQVFSPDGKFLHLFVKIAKPHGLAVDADGSVYVSDHSTGRVSIFNSTGQLTTCLDITTTKTKSLCGLAVDKCGVLYVCDREMNCIRLF